MVIFSHKNMKHEYVRRCLRLFYSTVKAYIFSDGTICKYVYVHCTSVIFNIILINRKLHKLNTL